MNSITPVTDGAIKLPPRKKATSRAQSARLWKRAKAQLDTESDLCDIEEESYMDNSDDPSDPDSNIGVEKFDPGQDTSTVKPINIAIEHVASGDTGKALDPHGEPLFDPVDLRHPWSAEWSPSDHVARYIAS
ncbi:Hypothetical predicted protein [Pelobates cultripes]|uniref:Uncharacterized protein n=1 Tax=Pelobates cultripes TaxID=61616 RepID=A0AAD1W0X8_PELCU|nr:Hypothetical predicted protein [Pelobates cultripes]